MARFCSASGVSPARARMLAYMPYCAGRLCVSIRVEFVMPGHLDASRHTNMQRIFVAMNGRAVITGRGACAITCVRGMGATCCSLCVLLVRARNIVSASLEPLGMFCCRRGGSRGCLGRTKWRSNVCHDQGTCCRLQKGARAMFLPHLRASTCVTGNLSGPAVALYR